MKLGREFMGYLDAAGDVNGNGCYQKYIVFITEILKE